jgi:hypothetical protein
MSIPVAAARCPECTAQITPGTEQPQPAGTPGAGRRLRPGAPDLGGG